MREDRNSIDLVRHFLPKSTTTKVPQLEPTKRKKRCHLYPASINTVKGMKWGFINQLGNLVISTQYDSADDFQNNGLAIVAIDNKVGLIQCSGQYLIRPKYESILPYTEGRAIVIDNKSFKVIDEHGKVLTPKAYRFIAPYENCRAVFADISLEGQYLYGYLDRNGHEIIPLQYEYATDFKDGKALVQLQDSNYALIDQVGDVLQSYSFQSMTGFSEGLSAFKKTYNEPFGYVDEQGNIVIQPRFSTAQPFQDGKAVVNLSDNMYNQYGLINKQGKIVIPAEYNDIIEIREGLVALGKAIKVDQPYIGSIYAIARTDGRQLTNFIYNSVSTFKNGLSSVTKGQSTFFINKTGTPAKNYPIVQGTGILSLENDLIKAYVDLRVMYYDRTGKIVWKPNTIIPLNNSYQLREVKFNPNKDYLVYYPQIEGMKNKGKQKHVNQILKSKSNVKEVPSIVQLDYSYTGDFSIEFYKNNLLVLKLSAYDYPFGAAHGMPSQKYVHLNLETGEIYELKDLFKANVNYVKVLSEMIGKQIGKDQNEFSYFFPEAYKGIKADQPFYITEDALSIYFLPYEIAAFAAGFPTFKIPYKYISDIINVDSSFWVSFH
ncbi:WG repeat-containing protein [Alkalihalobacillus sp. BA299]|uniref:WG repeat-containing protein n=1 Tax=Alkalihalobacillus sp. BA299 TaxID=2815938 RepID=UPI001AD9E347|nr:WG repeat-containing protein [Alkalihalobacillus sp. BA299]